jgi:hypothetical protein
VFERERLPNHGLLEAERSLLVGREVRWTAKKPTFPPAKGSSYMPVGLCDSAGEIKPQSREDARGQRKAGLRQPCRAPQIVAALHVDACDLFNDAAAAESWSI